MENPRDREKERENLLAELDIIMRQLEDEQGLPRMVLSRIIEKFYLLLIREPAALVGVEEHFDWIQRKLMNARLELGEELVDISYDLEDVIDDLILRFAAKQRRGGNWERCVLLIRIHKKLELIKSKIPSLPLEPVLEASGFGPAKHIEEIDWSPMFSRSPMFSIPSQKMANTVSAVEEKVSALLAQQALHPHIKKAAKRVLDRFRYLNGYVKGLESVNLDDERMIWMEELSRVSLSAVLVIDDFINSNEPLFIKRRRWGSSLFKFKSQNKLEMEMHQICDQIQNLSIRRPKEDSPKVQGRGRKFPLQREQQPTTHEPHLASFVEDVHAMLTRLLADDDSFRVIRITGMEGIGKTSLAKLIFNNKAVVDHFPFRVWTSLVNGSGMYQVYQDIMAKLVEHGMQDADDHLFNWKKKQQIEAFLIASRSLIVVDDPSHLYFPEDLLKILEDTSNGSRMIWISHEMGIPPILRKRSLTAHLLRLRGDEESWPLFTHALKAEIPPQLLKLKDEIVRRCGGLPRMIVKLAETLSHKDATPQEWSATLEEVYHDHQQLWSNIMCRINTNLWLYMRRCLLYFTLFPRDFDIPARRLIALWVAEGLVQPQEDNESPEDASERCLYFLIAQGIVQVKKKKLNGNVKTVRLPDTLRQYWLLQARQVTFHVDHTNNTTSESLLGTNMIRRLVDHLDEKDISFDHIHGANSTTSTSFKSHYKNVLSFISFDTRRESNSGEEVGHFLHRCICSHCFLLLKVLDLENVFRPKLREAVLGELTRLRYLGLRSTFIEKLPSSISKLQNVETLDVKHTDISTLPNSIWKLQRLRHLYLTEGSRSKLMPQLSIGSPTTLRTLRGLFIDEKTPLKDGLDKLLDLRTLQVALSSQMEVVADWVLKLKHLQSLRLKSVNEKQDLELKHLTEHTNLSYIYLHGRLRNPSTVSQFPSSVIDLTLSASGLTEDPMQSLDKLPNLKSLQLIGKSYLGKKMVCSLGGFPQLRVLKLWNLEQLEDWYVEEGALQAIQDLEIRHCERLKMIPEELLKRNLLKISPKEMLHKARKRT